MVTTKLITKAEFLELYADDSISKPLVVEVGTETRVYGLTRVDVADSTDEYMVVYCVM